MGNIICRAGYFRGVIRVRRSVAGNTLRKMLDAGTSEVLKLRQRQRITTKEARPLCRVFLCLRFKELGLSDKFAPVATVVSYATSGTTVAVGTMTANELAAYTGITLGVLTFLLNWYYRHQHLKIVQAQSKSNRG